MLHQCPLLYFKKKIPIKFSSPHNQSLSFKYTFIFSSMTLSYQLYTTVRPNNISGKKRKSLAKKSIHEKSNRFDACKILILRNLMNVLKNTSQSPELSCFKILKKKIFHKLFLRKLFN